ncbi:unnamed protein product [Clonostachys rhizophaga]|uniref:Uncharacterized protein n=1 Tax=Clonostachys rhizophaga TaxID=160324 RepID=A0A9N9V6I9_9HYPO|nr:unnamed protein product [Clonostachys rhizophaga]
MTSTACECAQRCLYSGAACVLAWHCKEHQYFAEISSAEVKKFPTCLGVSSQGAMRFVPAIEYCGVGETLLHLFKLDLMSHEPWTSNREDAAVATTLNARWRSQLSTTDDITPVAIYLGGLFGHTIKTLEHWIRGRNAAEVSVVVVLASPACWNTETNARFQRAVQLSGISSQQIIGDRTRETRIVFDSEHMAALRGIRKQEGLRYFGPRRKPEKFIVVDVGGVTIDAVVDRNAPGGSPSKSRLGGSLLVDCHFTDFQEEWIRKTFPMIPEQDQDLYRERVKVSLAWWQHMQKFNYLPHIPGPPLEVKLLEKTLTIGREEFKEFFKDTVEIIAKVVEDLFDEELEQTGDAPKFVTLTGGFSHCQWLFVALADRLKESPARNLFVAPVSTQSRWNAVAIGAAYIYWTLSQPDAEPQGEAPGDEAEDNE